MKIKCTRSIHAYVTCALFLILPLQFVSEAYLGTSLNEARLVNK